MRCEFGAKLIKVLLRMRKSKKLLAKEYEIGVMANMLERYSSIEICFDYYNRIGYAITCDSLDD